MIAELASPPARSILILMTRYLQNMVTSCGHSRSNLAVKKKSSNILYPLDRSKRPRQVTVFSTRRAYIISRSPTDSRVEFRSCCCLPRYHAPCALFFRMGLCRHRVAPVHTYHQGFLHLKVRKRPTVLSVYHRTLFVSYVPSDNSSEPNQGILAGLCSARCRLPCSSIRARPSA